MHILLVIPVTWWWFLGLTLDRGLAHWSFLAMLVVLLALLLWAATTIPGIFRIRLDYRPPELR